MKVLLLVGFVCAHMISITTGFYYGYGKGFDEKKLMKAIENKCVTNDNIKSFQGALNEFNHCISEISNGYSVSLDPFKNSDEFCAYLNNSQYHVCTKNLTLNILPCLSENETYLQKFILDAENIAFEEFCGENGVSNMQYVYDKVNRTAECIQMCGFLFYNYGACNTANLNIFKQLDKGIFNLNKNDVCSDLKSLHKCTTQVMEGLCNEEYSRFMDLIFHPFLKACNDLDEKK